MRVVDHLKSLGMGNREARDALATGKVRLRGCPIADPGREIDPAEIVVDANAPRVTMGRDPFVLWKDRDLLILWKPSGMLTVPAPGREDEPNALAWAGRLFGSAWPVHRLDEGTSGIMMVALRREAQEAIKALLERHAVDRRYLALVRGRFPDAITVDDTLVRDRGDGRRGPGAGGKRAITHFRLVEPLQGASLIEAKLETGRTHQVRIHAAKLGHPVFGDDLYGKDRGGRLALHAYRLVFQHPFATGREVRVEVPLADDLEAERRKRAITR
ncbi:MAG: RluA family pseudouridine synthase [Myxococcota bacterium]